MSELSPLNQILKSNLKGHQARIELMSNFIVALIRVRSVNLAEIATGFSGQAQVSSNYRRLQRFFKEFEIDFSCLARLMLALLQLQERWVLC